MHGMNIYYCHFILILDYSTDYIIFIWIPLSLFPIEHLFSYFTFWLEKPSSFSLTCSLVPPLRVLEMVDISPLVYPVMPPMPPMPDMMGTVWIETVLRDLGTDWPVMSSVLKQPSWSRLNDSKPCRYTKLIILKLLHVFFGRDFSHICV